MSRQASRAPSRAYLSQMAKPMPRADQSVLNPDVDANLSLVVHIRNVGGIEPAIRIERSDVRAFVIVEEHLCTPHQQAAGLAERRDLAVRIDDAHFDAFDRPAIGL